MRTSRVSQSGVPEMAEFTSEFKSTERSKAPIIMLAVAAVVVMGVALVWHYQKPQLGKERETAAPIVIPGMMRPGQTDFEAYKDKVRFEGVKAGIGFNFAGNRVAFIDGSLVNEGSRKLEAVEVHIALYDVYDKLCKEVTRLALSTGFGPMQPLEKRAFHANIESIDRLWNPQRVEITLTGLKYE